tara:strand:+ start:535 stop:1059 length:525 start_codon:yes stop_codon:yes gene_type:complete
VVEQSAVNRPVVGSNPTHGANIFFQKAKKMLDICLRNAYIKYMNKAKEREMKELTITAADWGLFEVTEEIVLKEMNVLNKEMFEGLLDIDAIELDIDFLDAEWGYCVDEEDGRGTILGLTDEFESYESFRTILAHEMIHAYQIQECMTVNHGDVFKLFGLYAGQKLGLDIQTVH